MTLFDHGTLCNHQILSNILRPYYVNTVTVRMANQVSTKDMEYYIHVFYMYQSVCPGQTYSDGLTAAHCAIV